MRKTANILRIEHISLNDGQGMRTVVFFKGCKMRCAWCSTPESQKTEPEVYFVKERCTGCGRCIAECPNKALKFDDGSYGIVRDKNKCTDCFNCVDICNNRGHQIYGKKMTVKEIMHEIRKDEIFYFYSGGGVTLSGGDIFCQTDFAEELLLECHNSCVDTCAELDMCTEPENVKRIVPLLDTVYIDIKAMDSVTHKKWTGKDNKTILENIKIASQICKKDAIHIRVPVIEGINDNIENIMETVEFCNNLENCSEIEFLPYHRLGTRTYERLQRKYQLNDRNAMNRYDVYKKIQGILGPAYNFDIKLSGMKIYDKNQGYLEITEEKLKQ